MTDSLIEKLSKETVKHVFYLTVVACFWGLSVFITKPELFKETLLVQIFVLFCVSFVWCFTGSLFGFLLETIFIKLGIISKTILYFIRVELYLLLAVIIKCIFMLFAYYYSFNFTEYLRFVFKCSITILLSLTLVFLMVKLLKSKHKKQEEF
jgi:hypothetical protein